ncbi:DUF6571 family protein [Streptomyces sp. CB02400]|uniref:DUF6571 family protein n=1 Tax=Streptomyces sp. CB02400 TaxID=1703944 RepID=UPI0009A0E563|nr:DUF6571 family protein [Streptomyces sp. CB02400]
MTTDLATLTTAADAWDHMAKEFGKQEKAYKRDVHGISMGPSWQGLSADAANRRFDTTLTEYQNAQTEAKAIASLLRDAHTQFTDLRSKLKTARQEAVDAGMKVSDQGRVSYDTQLLDQGTRNAYHHDPDYQESVRKSVRSWQDRIDQLVKDTTDADKGVEIAFNAVVVDSNLQDGTFNGFNGQAKGDIEKYEAENAEDIATRLAGGEKVSATELAELDRAFRDNAKSKEFSQTLLNGLGASGTMELTNRLSTLSHDGKNKGTFAGLQEGLANSLATATKNPDSAFYKKFRTDMQRVGVQEFDLDVASQKISVGVGHGQQVRGYQSLVTLMQEGNGYSGQFLKDLATDIRAAEDKKQGGNPDIWDLTGRFSGKEDGWFANDPLDGVLGIMAKDPETATSYLDPGPGGKNDNLSYLLTERDWDHVDTTRWQGKVQVTGDDTFDQDVRAGLGLALAAGATGNVAGAEGTEFGRHTAAQARVMHETVNLLDYGHVDGTFGEDKKEPRTGKADELLAGDEYASLRAPLSQALADYSPDVVETINGDAPGGRAGKADAYENGDESQIQNSRSSLIRMMRGVSEADDIQNFERIYHAQQGYMSEQLMDKDFPNATAALNEARKYGEVTGALNAVGGDVKMDVHDDKISEATDTRFYGYHIGGGMITNIPIVGDMSQRLVDISLNNWLAGVQAEEGSLAKEELNRSNDVAQDNIDRYFDRWSEERNLAPEIAEDAAGEAQQSYVSGRQTAYEALRSR